MTEPSSLKKALALDPQIANPAQRVAAIRRIVSWLRSDPEKRLEILIQTFQKDAEMRKRFENLIQSIFIEAEFLDFFCESGMSRSNAFFQELIFRLGSRFLPRYKDFQNASVIFCEIFDVKKDLSWIVEVKPEMLTDLFTSIDAQRSRSDHQGDTENKPIITSNNKLLRQLTEAEKILDIRLAELALSAEFRRRLAQQDQDFILIGVGTTSETKIETYHRLINSVYDSLDSSGVSIELVFLLDRMRSTLHRLSQIYAVKSEPAFGSHFIGLVSSILEDEKESSSLGGFLSTNLDLISKKIAERAGVVGQNYIARDAKTSRSLFLSAAGGGLVTTFTTFIKSNISKMGFPLFVEGFLAWSNYTLSFVLLQFLHFTLATKTPAMTASVLARKLRETEDFDKPVEFIEETFHIIRSGFLSILGNVIFVALGAIGFSLIYQHYFQQPTLTNEAALKYLSVHNPLGSLTIFYAIYTGAILWFGSAIGGWFENWYVYRKLNLYFEESYTLNRWLGRRASSWISRKMSENIMGLATNVALGSLLGFSTIFGKFFGVPVDVRHVTLSAGTLFFSFMSLDNLMQTLELVALALSSILIIGVLNFSVSFLISFLVAARARGLRLKQYSYLLRLIVRRFILKN